MFYSKLGEAKFYILGILFSRSLLDYYIWNLKLVLSPISPQQFALCLFCSSHHFVQTENYTWAKFFIPGLVFLVNQHKLRLFQLFRFNSGNQTLKENFSFFISKPWLLRKLLSILHGGNRWGTPQLVTARFSRSFSELIPYKEYSSKAIFNKLRQLQFL